MSSNEVKDFSSIFSEMLYNRIENIGSSVIIHNEKYVQLHNHQYAIFSKLKEVLTDEEKKSLVNSLEEISNLKAALTESLFYEQGIKDGFSLLQILKK